MISIENMMICMWAMLCEMYDEERMHDALDHVIWVMYAYWWNENDSAWHKAWYAYEHVWLVCEEYEHLTT